MSNRPTVVDAAPTVTPGAYAGWTLVGGLFGFGILGLLTIGIALIGLGIVLVLIGMLVPALRNRSMLAIIGGLAIAPLVLAWHHRGGPGTACDVATGAVRCSEQWSPWPFVGAAALLVAGSVTLILTVSSPGPRRPDGTSRTDRA